MQLRSLSSARWETLHAAVMQHLSRIPSPGSSSSIVHQGLVHSVLNGPGPGDVRVLFHLNDHYRDLKKTIQHTLSHLPGVTSVQVQMAPPGSQPSGGTAAAPGPAPPASRLDGLRDVQNIIAVSSCKGGVGKSTVAVNLAYSLAHSANPHRVGILDADLYGPSLPTLVRPFSTVIRESPRAENMILPLFYEGVKLMSFGWVKRLSGTGLNPDERDASSGAAVLRGPIASAVVSQLAHQTDWGELDYLIVDLPPGTGDILLTVCQQLKLSGAVVVTTPHKLSYVDVVKGLEMFDRVKVPTLGIVQNMSFIRCGSCKEVMRPFGFGMLSSLKRQYGIQNSWELPLLSEISSSCDSGTPFPLIEDQQLLGKNEVRNARDIFFQMAEDSILQLHKLKETGFEPVVSFDSHSNEVLLQISKDHIKRLDPLKVRKHCQCAKCVDEFSGKSLIDKSSIRTDVHPRKISTKGNYAVAIVWSDGHNTSIYPYEFLKNL